MRRKPIATTSLRGIGWAIAALLVVLLLGAGCRASAPALVPAESLPAADPPALNPTSAAASPTRLPTVATAVSTPTPLAPAATSNQPTPFYAGVSAPACGQVLAAVPLTVEPPTNDLAVNAATRAELQGAAPEAAWPALVRLLDAPGTVSLAAFQLGQADAGAYLNADTPMPLASVVKLITLVGYAEAVASGEWDPLQPVALANLDRYYLPRFDLGAHQRAVNELRTDGRVFGGATPTIALEDVAWMMVRHSSNAASDYLHDRLGQTRIEQIALDMGLTQQTAPCPFIGQFLMMGNHTRSESDITALQAFRDDPNDYGEAVTLLAEAYVNDADFREQEVAWRQSTRRPSIAAQRLFSETLNPQGTATEYAGLMARLAQNGLSSPESSYIARRILEWPMQFPANQALFSNVGYKNGSLPGVLTTAYYAYRWNDAAPVVVILFYRDLPQQTYRQWRWDLPHDELARWLLSDPAAIPLLRRALSS